MSKLVVFIKRTLTYLAKKYVCRSRNLNMKAYSRVKLSKQERAEIKSVWGQDFFINGRHFCYEFYKGFGSFSSGLVPNDVYAEAEMILNPSRNSLFLQHKCALKYIIPERNRPKTIVQKINDNFLDKENQLIDRKSAVDLLSQFDEFFIKVAVDSGGGRGVLKVRKGDDIYKLFNEYKTDFICQEALVEHDTLSQYNPQCINTIRVLSLNLNGKCTVLSSFIRMGGIGSVVDNLHSSKGTGVLVGLKPDGSLYPFGVDKHYNKVYVSPVGKSFEGKKVEHFDKVLDFVKYWHLQIPYANLIGWDIILDKSGSPIVIEINLDSADIAAHQVFNGPVFGNRLDEVIKYLAKQP